MEFDNKKVLITGSTRGIGYALAAHFLSQGATVALNGRSNEKVTSAIAELGSQLAVNAHGDITNPEACAKVVDSAIRSMGGLDILINNAGVFDIASIEDTDEAIWDSAMNTNVKAAFFCAKAALPALRDGGGSIINHASIAGLIGLANVAAYCTSKGALVQLTRSMAMELAPDIRVNCVCPTTVNNDMGWQGFNRSEDPNAAYQTFVEGSKMKRMPTNDDVVAAFNFLASEKASFMTGVALPVDGGKSAGA